AHRIETMRQGVRAGKSGSDEAGRNPRDSGRNHAKLRSVRLHRNPSITRFGDDCATGPTAGFAFILVDAAEWKSWAKPRPARRRRGIAGSGAVETASSEEGRVGERRRYAEPA